MSSKRNFSIINPMTETGIIVVLKSTKCTENKKTYPKISYFNHSH